MATPVKAKLCHCSPFTITGRIWCAAHLRIWQKCTYAICGKLSFVLFAFPFFHSFHHSSSWASCACRMTRTKCWNNSALTAGNNNNSKHTLDTFHAYLFVSLCCFLCCLYTYLIGFMCACECIIFGNTHTSISIKSSQANKIKIQFKQIFKKQKQPRATSSQNICGSNRQRDILAKIFGSAHSNSN